MFGALFVFRKYKHTEYIVTDKAVYVSGGLLSYTCKMKRYDEILDIDIRRGFIDEMLGVGDIVFSDGSVVNYRGYSRSKRTSFAIEDIYNYREVFDIIRGFQKKVEFEN